MAPVGDPGAFNGRGLFPGLAEARREVFGAGSHGWSGALLLLLSKRPLFFCFAKTFVPFLLVLVSNSAFAVLPWFWLSMS